MQEKLEVVGFATGVSFLPKGCPADSARSSKMKGISGLGPPHSPAAGGPISTTLRHTLLALPPGLLRTLAKVLELLTKKLGEGRNC